MTRIFTVGYANAAVADLVALARDGAVILDIRFNPTSRRPEWRQAALRRVLGPAYRHEQRLGNATYRGGTMAIVDLEAGAAAVAALARTRPVVLLCACAEVSRCHRLVVAEYLRERNPEVEVVHLQDGRGGGPRQSARECGKCGRYLEAGETECPFCAPPPSQPAFEDWCRYYGIILVPPLVPGEAPASLDVLRAQLALPGAVGPRDPRSTIPDAIVAAVARWCRGLEQLEQQLGRPVPSKWRQLNPGTVIEAEVMLQEAAADLGIAQPAKEEPEPEAEERWPVDPPFPEDEGWPG
jgi:hypothetical protein